MDVLFFLKERTNFIRRFYETAEKPFREIKQKIESKSPPFNTPIFYENEEPPYLDEWLKADEGLEVLGRTCLSMLSPSLHLYFMFWESELRVKWEEEERKTAFKEGFLHGYRYCFESITNRSWDECPADLELIEQITLARNRDQYPDDITTMMVGHSTKDLKKYPRPFFISETERRMNYAAEIEDGFLMNPTISLSEESLHEAINEVETLACWVEECILESSVPQMH